jgi:hypothetical protein
VQDVELAEVLDHGLLHAALEAEVELLQGLSGAPSDSVVKVTAVAGW